MTPTTPETGGAMCGGVMSETMMSDGIKKYGAYFGMMEHTMKDEDFEMYKNIKGEKDRRQFFKKNAHSAI